MQTKKDKRFVLLAVLALICVIVDQFTKQLVMQYIPLYDGFSVVDNLFNLVHVRNYGAAFGFLNSPTTDWQFWFFTVVTILAVLFILHVVRKAAYDRLLIIGFGLILGGAIGNFIDRIQYRYVIDFLDFYIGKWHWPVFNIADSTICIGTIIVVIIYLKDTKNTK